RRRRGPAHAVGRLATARTRRGIVTSARLAAWMVGALALVLVLQILVPGIVVVAVFTLALPIAIVAKIWAQRRAEADPPRDSAQALVSVAAALSADPASDDAQNGASDWGA